MIYRLGAFACRATQNRPSCVYVRARLDIRSKANAACCQIGADILLGLTEPFGVPVQVCALRRLRVCVCVFGVDVAVVVQA